jgi:hypothetical protein
MLPDLEKTMEEACSNLEIAGAVLMASNKSGRLKTTTGHTMRIEKIA